MARITRKELKTDKFALELGHGLTFFEGHQKEIIRYGGIGVAVVLLVWGFRVYQGHQRTASEAALGRAIQIQETSVGPPAAGAPSNFPTQQAKDETAIKAFTEVKTNHAGSDEAEIAEYFLGSIRADQGDFAGAEKSFEEVAQKGDARYSSLAKLSLGQVYFAQGRLDQGRKVLEDLIAHPSVFVSKEQASIALARALMPTKPADARKILDPLRNQPGTVGQVAITLYGELPPQ